MSATDLRFLSWLGTFCSPLGTTVGKVSTVIGRLARRGLLKRDGKQVRLTGAGLETLLASGWRAGECERGCACPCHFIEAAHSTPCCS